MCKSCYEWQSKLSDLEEKLAESERKNRDLHTSINLSIPNQIAMRDEIERLHTCRDKRISELVEENEQLKQKLAEKEKEIEALKQRLKDTIKIYSDDFVEKDKELNELRYKVRIANQAKTDFAIKQLEKVKEVCGQVWGMEYEIEAVEDYIDQQIKQLKEGK